MSETEKLHSLIQDYVRYAVAHGDATNAGDHRKANRSHDDLIDALHGIRTFGKQGDAALLSLLANENQSVRCWAATHSLKVDERKAVETLAKLSKEEGVLAFNSEMVLTEWKKGTLKIP